MRLAALFVFAFIASPAAADGIVYSPIPDNPVLRRCGVPSGSEITVTAEEQKRCQAKVRAEMEARAKIMSRIRDHERDQLRKSLKNSTGTYYPRSEEHTSELQSLMRISY